MARMANRIDLRDRFPKQVAASIPVMVKFTGAFSADETERALFTENAIPNPAIQFAF